MGSGADRRRAPVVILLILIFGLTVAAKAWVCDDAFITFRTIDNFVRGYGLRWNVVERVQVYTHPLWMLIMSGLYRLTHEFFYTSLALSIVLSIASVLLFAFGLAGSAPAACLGVAVLTASKAFTDYSTSGLENPLAHLLLALFLRATLRGDRPRRLVLLASLIGVTRMDLLLLTLPAVASACSGPFREIGAAPAGSAGRPIEERARRLGAPLRAAALGLLPLLIWEIFALVYYGFLFPNPAYAKLATGLPRLELLGRGLEYLLNSARSDPLTLAAIACGVGAALAARRRRDLAVGLGIALYLVYIVVIGGDFMSGRFLAAPLFAAVILWARVPFRPKTAWALACGVGLVFALLPAYAPAWIAPLLGTRHRFALGVHPAIDENGIADERAVYYDDSSLARAPRAGPWPNPGSAQQAAAIRADWVANTWLSNLQGFGLVDPDEASPTGALRTSSGAPLVPVVARSSIGFLGYYCGPGIQILDFQALGDPLLARLPALPRDPMLPVLIPRLAGKKYRIGHFVRLIPAGYFETLLTGENRIRDPRLAAYYDRLSLITRGSLWDARRLLEIIKMNLGIGDRPPPR